MNARLLQAAVCLLFVVCACAAKVDSDQSLLSAPPDLPLLATGNGKIIDPLSLVESESDAALVGEFPTQEYCGQSVNDAWDKADLLKKDRVPREDLVKSADKIAKYLPCPIYEYTGPKKEQEPIFHACCSYNTFFPGHHDYYCHTIQNSPEQKDEYTALKAQYDNWKKVSKNGFTVFSPLRFITPKCPHYTDRKHNAAFKSLWSDRVMKKVCESKNDCVGAGPNGENEVCCWSRMDTAPGMCSSKCSFTEREIQGRCDDTDDCKDVGGENTLVCCHDKKFGKGGGAAAERRGFCQASCSDEIAFNCGIDNKCSTDQTVVRTLKDIGGDKKNTCCQSLRSTMLSVPQRTCELSCNPTAADITAKDSPDLIGTMQYAELKPPKKVTDHAWNMQRFAQVAARIMERQEEIESFMQLQGKVTVAGSCADLTSAAQPLALHVANSGLAAVSPYLIMNMLKTDSFKDNFNKIHEKTLSAKDILEEPNEEELAALFGIDAKLPGARSIKPIRYFLGNFTWSPALDPNGKKFSPNGKWFATQTSNFDSAMDWILGQCKQTVIDSGAAFDIEGKAIPQYGIIAEWIHEKQGFKNAVERAKPQLQRDEIIKRRAAFNQARVCFSLWNRIYFGTQYLAAELAKEGEKDAAIWKTVSASVSAIGAALGPLTFGATNIAGKIASHFLTQHADKTKSSAERAQKALTQLMEITMSEIPQSYRGFCYKVQQGKGVQAMHDDNGKFDGDKVCDEQRYPAGIQPIITRLCFKDEVNEIIQLRKALDAKNKVATAKTGEVLQLEEQEANLQAEIKRILRTARAADRLLQAADGSEASEQSSSRLIKLKEADDAAKKSLAEVQQKLAAARAAQSASQQSASTESSGLADLLSSRSDADRARITRALELVRDQDYLRGIVHDFYLPCTWAQALPAQFEAIKYVFKQIASSIACDGGLKEPEAAQFFQLNVAHLTDVEKKLLDTYNKMLPNTEFALKVVNAINKLIELGAVGKLVDLGTSQLNAAVGFNVPNWESSLMNQGRDFLKQGAKDNLGPLGGAVGTGLDKVNGMVRGKDAIPGFGF